MPGRAGDGDDRLGCHRRGRGPATKDTLLADALASAVNIAVPVPDTGSIDTDLREFARSIATTLTSSAGSAAARALFAGAASSPRLAEIKRNLFAGRHKLAAPIAERAIRRGELPASTDPRELIGLTAAPLYYRFLVTGEPIDYAVADRAAVAALAAARAGTCTS
jgi:hypothetical protein